MNTKISWISSIKTAPRWFWLLIVTLFILGWWIGHSGSQKEFGENEAREEVSQTRWWTCSMHPQIKLPQPGQCPICFMDLIPVDTGTSDEGPRELKISESAMKLAEIETERVGRGSAVAEIRLSGKIVPDERRFSVITAWVPGRIEKLFVDFTGIRVTKGDPLVKIYSPALYASQEELLQSLGLSDGVLSTESSDIVAQAAREKLVQLGLKESQIQDIEKRGTAIDTVILVSPLSGVVIRKNAIEGQYMEKGDEIVSIADLSQVWIILDAYEKDIEFLHAGQRVTFEVEAFPGAPYFSTIAFIDPVLDETTRSVQVRLDVPNPAEKLKPGMFVRAVVSSNAASGKTKPLLIPASAPLITGRRAVVYVKKSGMEIPSFEGREVILGHRVGDQYIVVSGLTEGEDVVVNGGFKIDSEMQIQAKPSLMNTDGGMVMTGHEHHGGEMPSSTKTEKTVSSSERMTKHASVEFRKFLESLYDTYFKAQTALAGDDFKSAQTALILLHSELQSPVTGFPSLTSWAEIRDNLFSLTEHAPHLSDIESARKAFSGVSEQVIRIEKAFGHSGVDPLYQVHCPMAFGNQGADWLQTDSTISNPYFGSIMPRCGEITEVFKQSEVP